MPCSARSSSAIKLLIHSCGSASTYSSTGSGPISGPVDSSAASSRTSRLTPNSDIRPPDNVEGRRHVDDGRRRLRLLLGLLLLLRVVLRALRLGERVQQVLRLLLLGVDVRHVLRHQVARLLQLRQVRGGLGLVLVQLALDLLRR